MIFSLRIPLFLSLMFLPQLALAHSPIKGIGSFLNGMLHPLLVPAQVLIILALGLWYGQHQPAENKTSVLVFLFATIAGLVISNFSMVDDVSLLLLIGATVIGLIIISGITVPPVFYIFLGISAGFIVGLDSAQEALTGKAKILSLFGSGVGIYFLLLYAMAISETLSVRHWQVIAVRVIASWLSASAMMVLALSFSH
jgi:urease accessory protein